MSKTIFIPGKLYKIVPIPGEVIPSHAKVGMPFFVNDIMSKNKIPFGAVMMHVCKAEYNGFDVFLYLDTIIETAEETWYKIVLCENK